ncbi:MAG: glycosyltransferase family 2 protein [Rhodococcus sp. (in: high G+C Gram-positive bacteria)]
MPVSDYSPTLSVIVPAYNEEAYIQQCLEQLVLQIDHLHEIIVVDNNSTDGTAAVVDAMARVHSKVHLIQEPVPGVAHARNAGFNAATGDLLGRVDADTRIRPGWAQAVRTFMSTEPNGVAGVTGLNEPYDSPVRRLKAWWFGRHIKRGTVGGGRLVTNLHGANMAIRRSAWRRVESKVSTDPDLHEDLDLALCLGKADLKIAQLSDMNVLVSPRRALTPPSKFHEYIDCGVRTFAHHDAMTQEKARALRLHWWWHILVYATYRPYDPRKQRYSLRYLLSPVEERVLPVATGASHTRTTEPTASATSYPQSAR